MGYEFFDHTGDVGVALSGRTPALLFAAAAEAFTDTITPLLGVEPRRPEEVDLAAPELDLLLVDFLSELLYRFDTRGWLTRQAELVVREEDGGWLLEGTLRGEKLAPERHGVKVLIKAVTYHGLRVEQQPDGDWTARIVFDI
jgi:SHS2 domain-containing protein